MQRARFAAAIADLPEEQVLGPVAARIEQFLLAEQLQHQQALDKAMNGPRYLALLTEPLGGVTDPPFTDLALKKPAALKGAVRSAAKKVTKHLAAGLDPSGDDEELHKARKAGKRARYAAELAEPVLARKPRPPSSSTRNCKTSSVTYRTGSPPRTCSAGSPLAPPEQPNENGFTYGLLYAQELHRAEESR